MKKIILSLLGIFMAVASFSQTNVQINISTGTTPWTISPGATAVILSSPHPIWQGQVVTPVAVTGARWINSTGSLTASAGTYTYEKAISVPVGTKNFNLNFQVSADDILQTIELVKPNNSILSISVPAISTSQPYALRRAVDTTLICPDTGMWKLRMKVQFLDQIGALLVSGRATLTPGVCCTCGSWKGFNYNIYPAGRGIVDNAAIEKKSGKTLSCGQTIVIKAGSRLRLNPLFNCAGNCPTTYKATVTLPNGSMQSINSFPYNFIFAYYGYYVINVTPYCGGAACTPCRIRVFVTPGCEGDVITPFKKLPDEIIELHEAMISSNTLGELTKFTIKAEGEKMTDLGAGEFAMNAAPKKLVLRQIATGKIIKEFAQHSFVPSPGNFTYTCEQQEEEQWARFSTEIAPGLINSANTTCRAISYCLQIYCDGQPTKAVLLLIKPTSRSCIFINAESYHAIFRFDRQLIPATE